jgi:branched-chain amino acid transport system ATP-binding protein
MTVTVSPPLFEIDNLSASYSSYRALFGVSLSVPERGILALLGSNGAGKSTLARVATGLVPATSGAIRLDGVNITNLAAHKIARLGVAHVPEGRGLFASLSVEENLTLGFRQKLGRAGVAEALERAYGAFPVLAERRRQMGGTLSGGQQRMLSLARVLATSPRVLIVDELSLGLAPVIIDAVYEGLLAVRDGGCAIIVVEQQVQRALAIADQAVLLAHGSVAWSGPADQATAAVDAMLSIHQLAIEDGVDPMPNGNSAGPPRGSAATA